MPIDNKTDTTDKADEGKMPPNGQAAKPGQTNQDTDKKTGAAKSRKKPGMSNAQASQFMGAAAGIICVAGLALFVISQMFTGQTPRNDAPPDTDDPISGPVLDTPGPENTGTQAGTDKPAVNDPFNRIQWEDGYKLETDDGQPAGEAPGSKIQDGARYWVRDRSGNKTFKIVIPAGYTASDMGDCFSVGMGEYAATGDDPITFFWQNSAETRILLETGYYDHLARSGTSGYARYDLEAQGYYMFEDEDGVEWPVVTALLSRVEDTTDYDGSYYEYRIIVGKPAEDGKWLVGTIPADGFESMKTQLCPDITSFAKAMFPASTAPGFPANWGPPAAMEQPDADMGTVDTQAP